MRVDDIVFEYRFNEFRFSNKIRKSYESEENKKNLHIAERLKSVDSMNLIRI